MIKAKITPDGEKWIKDNRVMTFPDEWLAGCIVWIYYFNDGRFNIKNEDKTLNLLGLPLTCLEIVT